MQICEYYQRESHGDIEFFEGRWHWEIQNEKVKKQAYLTTFEWTDLFGKEDKVKFTSKQPQPYVEKLLPLTHNFGLLSTSNDGADANSVFVVEFDWDLKEFHVGAKAYARPSNYRGLSVLLDRKCPEDGDLNVLIYDDMNNFCQHCRVDTKNRQIVKNSSVFRLPLEDFNCLKLDGDVITGLSEESDDINRFDVRRGVKLDQREISGLPPIVKYKWSNVRQRENGCWTSYNQLFVSSKKKEFVNGQKLKYFQLHCFNLDTGKADTLSYKFPHRINEICQSLKDGNLYVKCNELVGFGYRNEKGEFVPRAGKEELKLLSNYHFYRILAEHTGVADSERL